MYPWIYCFDRQTWMEYLGRINLPCILVSCETGFTVYPRVLRDLIYSLDLPCSCARNRQTVRLAGRCSVDRPHSPAPNALVLIVLLLNNCRSAVLVDVWLAKGVRTDDLGWMTTPAGQDGVRSDRHVDLASWKSRPWRSIEGGIQTVAESWAMRMRGTERMTVL